MHAKDGNETLLTGPWGPENSVFLSFNPNAAIKL